MASLRKVSLRPLFYFVIWLVKLESLDSIVSYDISRSEPLMVETREACNLTLQCTGELHAGNITLENPWHYIGLGNPRVKNTSNILVTTEMFAKPGADGIVAFVSNLTFFPVDTFQIINCETSGSILIFVDEDPIAVMHAIPSVVDISEKRMGDIVTLSFDVETCLMDIRVSFYKGQDLVHSISSAQNRQRYIYEHQVSENSVGNYSYRVSSRLASTPLLHFTITGSPLPASIN